MNAIPSLRTRCPRTRAEPRANARGTSEMGAAWFSGFGDLLAAPSTATSPRLSTAHYRNKFGASDEYY